MARLLALVRYNVVLILTLVENSICISRGKYLSSLSARSHLYSQKFKRIALVLALLRYDVSVVLALVHTSIVENSKEWLVS